MKCSLLILLLIPGFAAGPATAPTPDQLFDKHRSALRQQQQEVFASLKQLGRHKASDLLELKLDTHLIITPKITPTQEMAGVQIEGIDALACVDVRGSSDNPADASIVQLQTYNYSHPGELQRHTSLFASPHSTQLTQLTQAPLTSSFVQLVQSVGEDESNVVLSVTVESDFTGDLLTDMTVRAENLVQLMREYPREFHTHAAPMLRELDLEAPLLAPDLLLARKVLKLGAGADEKTAAQVRAVLPRMEAADFATREKAKIELRNLGRAAADALGEMNRAGWTPARVAAVDAFLAEMNVASSEEAGDLSRNRDFLIRCLYIDDPDIRKAAGAQLQKVIGRKLDLSRISIQTIDRLCQQLIPPSAPQPRSNKE